MPSCCAAYWAYGAKLCAKLEWLELSIAPPTACCAPWAAPPTAEAAACGALDMAVPMLSANFWMSPPAADMAFRPAPTASPPCEYSWLNALPNLDMSAPAASAAFSAAPTGSKAELGCGDG